MTSTGRHPAGKRAYRSGVYFDCPECGRLWKDDDDHADTHAEPCPGCTGPLRLVGRGERMVEFAKWYRCSACLSLFMWRRQELVATRDRSGFAEFT